MSTHVLPSPLNPSKQVHVNDPGISSHCIGVIQGIWFKFSATKRVHLCHTRRLGESFSTTTNVGVFEMYLVHI